MASADITKKMGSLAMVCVEVVLQLVCVFNFATLLLN